MNSSSRTPNSRRHDGQHLCQSLTPADIERLGRKRPDMFKSVVAELGFCFSLFTSLFMAEYFISGFNIILPTLSIALKIPAESRTWPASVFSLVTGAFLLPFSRFAEIYGSYEIFVGGLVWFLAWSLIAGFSRNFLMLNICRALQGLGPAAFLPSGVMLLGSTYRPGPRKNLIFSLYGAFAPVGFFSGILFGGISGQNWEWYFWAGAIMLCVTTLVAIFAIPRRRLVDDIKMDWWGAFTIVPGLLLVVYALTDSSHAPHGWTTPYIYVTVIAGSISLCAAFYVEGWVSEMPLLPFDLFAVKLMKPLVISLFFSYGVFGLYLFYASFYIETILGVSPLLATAWFAPMAAGGLILATLGGFTLHLLPGKVLLVISGVGCIASVLLFAIIPEDPNYWAYVFPAMLGATVGGDITYSVTNVYITTKLPTQRQGLAGAFINSIVFLGISFILGFADLAVANTAYLGLRGSYKVAFWLGVGCAGFAMILVIAFVDIGKAKSDLTAEEKAELEADVNG